MPEYYKIEIGGVWFTSDGTETGEPCRVDISGLDELLHLAGNTGTAASGKPKTEFALNEGRGVSVELKFASVEYSKHEALKTLFDTNAPFAFRGFGLAGDFEIGAVPNYAPVPIQRGVTMSLRMKNYIVRIKTDDLPV